jgi:D-glycero-alpha-D-manno-heptose-7-phosphate kinase
MMVRSRAPLRLGLAGGGTDVSPYSDLYGGAILNATIDMYAYATIEPLNNGKIVFNLLDKGERYETASEMQLELDGNFDLFKGIYNRVVDNFTDVPLSFRLSTYVDAPAGSGIGTSSTLLVTILGAYAEWLKLPLGEYDIAHLAYEIERLDLGMAGGKQDQYAAAFGGYNFMEFYEHDKVIVNPLRIKQDYLNELQINLLLYYTGTSRLSSKIIEAQQENVISSNSKSIEAMHKLKEQSVMMKEAILKGRFDEIGKILDFGWQYKKKMTEEITNPVIDEIYQDALSAGATGGKISGAGGGGFMILYCPGNTRYDVIDSLKKFDGEFRRYNFTESGLTTWIV